MARCLPPVALRGGCSLTRSRGVSPAGSDVGHDSVAVGQLTGFHVYLVDGAVSVEQLLDIPRTGVIFEIAAEHLQDREHSKAGPR